ncbi:bifunctional 3,4-dihydroxy-2-butanone-4-phosphate synthase/GTP cyclohydrolase II [Rhodococcus sp. RS1C4]|nr:bifunctional 3,4-dihydroxy-2-butanone-4-phosphate synthase/GTP cyclohydrolase II [Rhodococcus sp. RS1C4]OZC60401.1 bifunctional 3,4-dihydroxy-2-butanone-4-phosphate synthase/GTP cyclohydrolase II [Rhodococcus sp. 06-621-2]OZC78329.1 bifunctional 3,4-dihydroxy-2-butanone-4-phosphate synthase/GTP cyclohydrolase II [Rhodococcus sp. 06-418-1B]OZD17672.1 bifunctional 3,4-dihydroxy-2-butanone-4-phosphate synthase/GTP cyclohydrolase II [Rhodococcus sp. 06-156-4C]OZD20294.1 bifunctional 3,4-dihydrox
MMKEALDALRAGKPVLVTDDARRENEGDVILAADRVTPEWTAWTIRNTSGLLCAPMSGARADALELPPMVADNQDPKKTAYTVTVDAAEGVTTGISAADRARTLQVLADPSSSATDLIRPGHVIPLRARPGGVLERPGHTEAAVDLCSLAGVPAVGVIAELVADDGTMMTFPDIELLGRRMQLPVLTIEQLINYRLAHGVTAVPAPRRVERVAETVLTTAHGEFRAIGYADKETGAEHIALVKGELAGSPIVRVHSECLTGESFSSQRCECGPQLDAALARVSREGGVVVYLRGHEGRGIGLLKKLAAYRLQDQGFDTMQANLELDELADGREYGGAAAILDDLEVADVRLLTNNPLKVDGLRENGIAVTAVIPLLVGAAPANVRYLETKRDRMGHLLPGHLEQSM